MSSLMYRIANYAANTIHINTFPLSEANLHNITDRETQQMINVVHPTESEIADWKQGYFTGLQDRVYPKQGFWVYQPNGQPVIGDHGTPPLIPTLTGALNIAAWLTNDQPYYVLDCATQSRHDLQA